MIYIAYWIICATCTYFLGRNYIENLFRPFGGLVSVCKQMTFTVPETPDDEKWELEKIPNEFIGAILWTLFLVACFVTWPVVICILIWWYISPPDTTEIREMFK